MTQGPLANRLHFLEESSADFPFERLQEEDDEERERTVPLWVTVKTFGKQKHAVEAAQEVRRLVESEFSDVHLLMYDYWRWCEVPRTVQEIEHPRPMSS